MLNNMFWNMKKIFSNRWFLQVAEPEDVASQRERLAKLLVEAAQRKAMGALEKLGRGKRGVPRYHKNKNTDHQKETTINKQDVLKDLNN